MLGAATENRPNIVPNIVLQWGTLVQLAVSATTNYMHCTVKLIDIGVSCCLLGDIDAVHLQQDLNAQCKTAYKTPNSQSWQWSNWTEIYIKITLCTVWFFNKN